jgi:hypothetical protein
LTVVSEQERGLSAAQFDFPIRLENHSPTVESCLSDPGWRSSERLIEEWRRLRMLDEPDHDWEAWITVLEYQHDWGTLANGSVEFGG